MEQTIELMSPEELDRVEAQRKWVRDHYEAHAQSKYDTLAGKLGLLDAILSKGWVRTEETFKLQCLGVTFGDALAQELGLRWVTVEDEYGRNPALQLVSTSVLVFPMTSISKRIERGDTVDVLELFNQACVSIRDTASRCG